jgi:acylphosphatase
MGTALTAKVIGRVQGVGFRFYVKTRAEELGITGWVRNLPDGSVQTEAFGPRPDLERFMHYLETGPIGSRVDRVDFQWIESKTKLKNFEISG